MLFKNILFANICYINIPHRETADTTPKAPKNGAYTGHQSAGIDAIDCNEL